MTTLERVSELVTALREGSRYVEGQRSVDRHLPEHMQAAADLLVEQQSEIDWLNEHIKEGEKLVFTLLEMIPEDDDE